MVLSVVGICRHIMASGAAAPQDGQGFQEIEDGGVAAAQVVDGDAARLALVLQDAGRAPKRASRCP